MLLWKGRRVVMFFVVLLPLILPFLVRPEVPVPQPSSSVSSGSTRDDSAVLVPPDASSDEGDQSRFLGVILPYEAVDVSATVDGQIEELRVRIGDGVRRRDLIASVSTATPTAADLAMAEAELRAAQAQAQQLTIEFEQVRERLGRSDRLSQRGLVTAEQMSDVRFQEQLAAARVEAAEATVAQKRAAVEQRKAVLLNAEVRAPFDGVVATRYVGRGARVDAGAPIVRLVRVQPLKLRFAVPKSQSQMLRVGEPIVVTVEDLRASFKGTVESIAPEVDIASQMLMADAILVLSAERDSALSAALAGRVASVVVSRRSDPIRSANASAVQRRAQ